MGRIFLFFLSCWTWAQDVLPEALRQAMQQRNVQAHEISIWVQALDQQQPLVDWQSRVARNPASVAKLLTTAAGLSALGGDFRWHTDFYIDQQPDAQGVLHGNLYVRGGGDPFLVEERLRDAIQQLQQRGIRHLQGAVILDDSFFRLSAEDKQVLDGAHTSEYNAIPHPLMVNFRTLELNVSPRSASTRPPLPHWRIVNQIQATKQPCQGKYVKVVPQLKRLPQGYAELHLTGQIPSRCPEQHLRLVLGEGNELFFSWFKYLWEETGASFRAEARVGAIPKQAQLIYRHPSVALRDAIASMNQHSNNVMTRHLLLTLAPQRQEALHSGRAEVLKILTRLGVQTRGIHLDNGAGLSRETRVTAQQLAQLLSAMSPSVDFVQSLAVTGESGTLKKRFRNQALQGKIYGKTGTLRDVRAFAGYQQSASGRWFIVIILGQGKSASASRLFQDDVFQWIDGL